MYYRFCNNFMKNTCIYFLPFCIKDAAPLIDFFQSQMCHKCSVTNQQMINHSVSEHFPEELFVNNEVDFLLRSSLLKDNCTVYIYDTIIYP